MGRRERIDEHVAAILGLDARALREGDAAPRLFWRSAAGLTVLVIGLAAPGPDGSSRRRAETAYAFLSAADLARRPGAGFAPGEGNGEPQKISPGEDARPPDPHLMNKGSIAQEREAPPRHSRRAGPATRLRVARLEGSLRPRHHRASRRALGAVARAEQGAPPTPTTAGSRFEPPAPALRHSPNEAFSQLAENQRRAEQRARLDAVDAIRFLRQK